MAAAVQVEIPAKSASWPASLPVELQALLSLINDSAPGFNGSFSRKDWDRVVLLAELHGVIPLLRRNLSHGNAAIPSAAHQRICELDAFNTQRAVRLTRELSRVFSSFQQQSVPVLPYKGPALSQFLYGDSAMRQSGDLDLLVRTCDVRRAAQVLNDLGYRSRMPVPEPHHRAYVASGYEQTFNSDAGENILELKWRILPRFYAVDFVIDDFFTRAVKLPFYDCDLPTLCPEDLLLVLCVHAAKHVWAKLCWLCDIGQLLKICDLHWDTVHRQAQALGIMRILQSNLLLAHKLLGVALPHAAQEWFVEPALEKHLEGLLPQILNAAECNTENFSYFHLMASLREHPNDRARFWWRLASTPSHGEWSAITLPDSFSFLYRGVRAYRVARRALAELASQKI